MLDKETKDRINTARDILVGKVPDPKSQVEQITIALIYKFMDDMDLEAEELGGARSFFSGEYAPYAWHKLFDPAVGGETRLQRYSEALLRLGLNPHLPALFRDIFKNAYLPYRDPETLSSFLKIINGFRYDHSERLGDAFEFLLSVLGSQGDAGQFRTPRHLIDFMTAMVDPQKDETVLDPACGTAGFLISSYKHILKHNSANYDPQADPSAFELHGISLDELGAANGKKYKGDRLSPDDRKRLVQNFRGYDISPDMVRLSLVNLYLHGFSEPRIYEYDTLTSEARWNEYYDVILANPPFMSPKGGIRPHSRFSIASNRSEVLFVDYIAEHLTPRGRAAIIVPEGIIFQTGTAYKALRKMLVESGFLVGVVSLPAGVFNPYSGVKTSILWIDKTLASKTDKLLFLKIENDGFDLGAQRRPLKSSELPEAFRQIEAYKSALQNGTSFDAEHLPNVALVEKTKVAEGGEYGLSGERYRGRDMGNRSAYDLVEIGTLCSFEYGKPLKSEDRKPGDYPVFGSNGVVGYHNEYLVEAPFLVIGRKGSAGEVVYSEFNGYPIDTTFYVKLDNEASIKLKYLYYLLKSLDLKNLNVQAGVPGLNRNDAYKLQIPLPPLPVQEEIVAEIEGYERIIAGARQVVESYRPRIEIQPEWAWVELGEVCEKVQYGISEKMNTEGLGFKTFRMNELIEGFAFDNREMKYSNISEKEFKKYKLEKGDLLFNRTNSFEHVGRTGIFDLDGDYCFASYLIRLQVNRKKVDPYFLNFFMNTSAFQSGIKQFASRAIGQANINATSLKSYKIPLPDLPTQARMVAAIERERALVAGCRELMAVMEEKVRRKVAGVWGE
jgi:type I restriction enzyme M protein